MKDNKISEPLKPIEESMFQIDKQQFGIFISELRKENGYTQKELAQKLFLSDKAVSKWERGLSMPDISLLVPLAENLGVTVTELLKHQHMEQADKLNTEQVEEIVKKAINFSEEHPTPKLPGKKTWGIIYAFSLLILAVELAIYLFNGYSINQIAENCYVIVLLGIFLGCSFIFFVKEKLPSYYDENRISGYLSGPFRINLPGLAFNNSNHPYILFVIRTWSVLMIALFPLIYYLFNLVFASCWAAISEYVVVTFTLVTLFVPLYIVGKKYES